MPQIVGDASSTATWHRTKSGALRFNIFPIAATNALQQVPAPLD
jgi:hypothetical protein